MQTPDATGTAPTIAETLAKLGADPKAGLTDAEVQARLKKYGPTLGVFLLPILKEKFGVPSVLGIVSAVSLLGLVVTLILGREDTE